MKKTKIITISILGLLLLVPFMMPTKAAPASYVPVAEEQQYYWTHSIKYGNWTIFTADDMSGALAKIFNTSLSDTMQILYNAWVGYYGSAIISWWPMTIIDILPENTSAFLNPDFSIPDTITHTPVNIDAGYEHLVGAIYYSDTWYVVNDSASFAAQSLYGGAMMSPYGIIGVPFAPLNMDWAVFAAAADAGMDNYWGGWAANTTVSALASGYSMSVPIGGYENNTLAITMKNTYTTGGILNYSSLTYGTLMITEWKLLSIAPDVIDPVTTSPIDFAVDDDYTGESLSWTATDANPGNYTITLDTTPVVTTTPWVNGTPVTYNISDGLAPGAHTFVINFSDAYSNSKADTVVMTVNPPDTTDPVITSSPTDLVVDVGYTGQSLSWTATDTNAVSYSIKGNGSVIVSTTSWTSGTPVTYNIPDGYPVSTTTYEITFTDLNGNTATDSATLTVEAVAVTTPPAIPGFEPLIVIGIATIGSIGLIALKKKKK